MKEISLTQGYVALVDDEDYEELSQYRWYVRVNNHHRYASRKIKVEGKWVEIHMHRCLLSAPDNLLVDHVDGNGLNNVRANLRLATKSGNNQNSRMRKDNTSGYKGVNWSKEHSGWRAEIKIDGKSKFLGYFQCPIEAAKIRDKAALELHGEFALLNFPKEVVCEDS